jgi:hypothetical protein
MGGKNLSNSELMLRTADAGINWSAQTDGNSYYFYSVSFPNSTTGYAVGARYDANPSLAADMLMKTTNSGTNWVEEVIPHRIQYLRTVNFPDQNTGYAAGDNFTIHKYSASSVGIENNIITKDQILIYPNPGKGLITIRSENLIEPDSKVLLYTISGQAITANISFDGNSFTINTTDLSFGLYILELQTNGKIYHTKLIVE